MSSQVYAKINSWQKIWTRSYGVHFITAAMIGLSKDNDLLKNSVDEIVSVPELGGQGFYVKRIAYANLTTKLKDYYIKDLTNLDFFIKNFLNFGQKFVENSRKNSKNLTNINNHELFNRLKKFIDDFNEYNVYTWVTFIVNELMSIEIDVQIKKLTITQPEKEELLQYAVQPTKLSSILLLNKEAKIKNLEQLVDDFGWITTLDVHDEPAKKKDITDRLTINELYIHKEPTFFLELPLKIQKLTNLMRDVTYSKDIRDDFRRKAMREALPLFNEIAKRSEINRKNLSYLTVIEIEQLLLKEKPSSFFERLALNRQKEGFMLILVKKNVKIIDNLKSIKIKTKQLGISEVGNRLNRPSIIKGLIGQKGKVKGPVKILKSLKDAKKIEPGDILCSVTTNPDYLPLMKKAAAFVTDEGGITCHAAIVAREMNKPCIVGTKIATHVLKDGDNVLVDADFGKIKLIQD
jgi:phosphohistidine swiveling domain-containing protein